MAGKPKNLVGQRFEKLIVIGESIMVNGKSHSLCRCDCGNEKLIANGSLKTGNTKSCGCIKSEDLKGKKFGRLLVIAKAKSKNNKGYSLCKCDCGNEKEIKNEFLKKGEAKSCNECLKGYSERLKRILKGMKRRCYNKNVEDYKHYGGRGIKVYDEWLKYSVFFYKWALENGYDDNLSIDRIDVDGDYEPSNCRWATKAEQSNNKRNSVFLIYNNEKKTITEWSEIYNITMAKVSYRYKKGLQFEEIFEINKDGE